MAHKQPMRLSDFDFELPDQCIALRPARPRDSARLLEVSTSGLRDGVVTDLVQCLRPGDALVFNDTRVIPARLRGLRAGRREGGGDGTDVAITLTLHQRDSEDCWSALARPGKRLREGDRIRFAGSDLTASVVSKQNDGEITLRFDRVGAALDAAIATVGVMPLPPYIAAKRDEDAQDSVDYQTVYARHDGSVASPTAGLHFTDALLDHLATMGVSRHFVTLHVGAGTFLPVKTDDVCAHRMHAETGEIEAQTAQALNAVRAAGGRIVCVGTTSLRLLESAVDADGRISAFRGDTAIFITPGYRFRTADLLMTNFHLPKSTLFMLVCAFGGTETLKGAYAHAIATGYRFYSYGDTSLITRADP